MQTSANRLGSVTNGKGANGQIQPYEPSVTPTLPDFEPTMCFVPTGYPPHAYYYGGKSKTSIILLKYVKYPCGCGCYEF